MKFIIKLILAMLAVVFGAMLFFWLFGLVTSLLWYAIVFGVIGAIGYSGYKLFRKAEDKFVGPGNTEYLDSRDFDTSWDEYKQKYLTK
jgi:uncharacterized membrane protein